MAVAELTNVKGSALGQYLGYALQPVRLCYHLLTAPKGSSVSLEYIDDIAIHDESQVRLLEQTKSALSGNPATDRSSELWKTLGNWAELCIENLVDPNATRFRYYVTPLKTGTLVEDLNAAHDIPRASELLEKFKRKKFQGEPGVGIEPQIKRFLAAGDETCLKIILRFEFVSEPDPLEEIRTVLRAALPENTVDNFIAASIGLAKDEIDELIRSSRPPVICSSYFRNKFQAFIRKYDFSNLLIPTISPPSSEEVSTFLRRPPTFVRQLAIIAASESLVRTAVSDFLRTIADKTNWAVEGNIVENSLDELDRSLIRHHALCNDEITDIHAGSEPEEIGRNLYRKCIALQLPLEGRALPTYFVSGEFNCLADDCQLGWHPDYKAMFSGDVDD